MYIALYGGDSASAIENMQRLGYSANFLALVIHHFEHAGNAMLTRQAFVELMLLLTMFPVQAHAEFVNPPIERSVPLVQLA